MDPQPVPSAASLVAKPESIIKKVPGKLVPLPKEKDVYMGDLSKKSVAELKELLERQVRILSNKSLVNKLADKGSKATELKERIEKELQSRDDVNKAANLLSAMSLNQLNALEWTGHCTPGLRYKHPTHESVTNIDYEETDPLKILVSHSGTTDHQKHLRILKPEASLIKPEDLIVSDEDHNDENIQRVESKQDKESDVIRNETSDPQENKEKWEQKFSPTFPLPDEPEPFAHFICERYGHKEAKERFKPNKPLKPFTGSFPLKPTGRVSSKPKRWEETNVTPPLPLHPDTKLLSIEESLELQREQNQKLKEVQMRHAAEKLSSLHGIRMAEDIPISIVNSMAYRGQAECNSDSDDDCLNDTELEENHDEDQLDTGTTVVYTVET
ncbi:DNA-directed RNA polymerase II subunit GRINL1A [Thrips palmi]|uniref:DNA-directed RNA polymerase II subunit GRINL1A n=1 Tax=Thrips palmi TaxID=161013 RepID=A0A6P9ADM8_THRPL|nr:DNA-directed RNA polymerase II subunit GRINL1A [Thrips palmi]